jgi:hypothetical protein
MKREKQLQFALVVGLGACVLDLQAATLQVGATRLYRTPCAAFAVAENGDVIEIDAGTYAGDVCSLRASDVIIRGVGGRPHIAAGGTTDLAGGGIWTLRQSNTTIENIEFSGASHPDENGAALRGSGGGFLIIRRCYFHDNENGILTDTPEVLIEYSEFARNGFGDGQSHNMYISSATKFTLRYSYSHHAKIGHNVKSRAKENYILYNRIMDEADGTASYAIDLPDGGASYVIGNLIQQGPFNDNSQSLAYGQEGFLNARKEIYVVNNTFVNDSPGTFINIRGTTPAANVRMINNLFVGSGAITNYAGGTQTANLIVPGTDLVNRSAYDYRLVESSSAVDAGVDPGSVNGLSLTPTLQYQHSSNVEPRPTSGPLDVGAYELAQAADADGDGILDDIDNCRLVANANQRDTNGDGYGNLCDPDLNNDGIVNSSDLALFKQVFTTRSEDADFNGDGIVNNLDIATLKKYFLKAPGP